MWRGLAIGAGAVLIIGAAIFYFAVLPGIAAGDYRDDAKAEHDRIRREIHAVFPTFRPDVLGARIVKGKRAKTIEQRLTLVRREVAARRRRLEATQAALRNARNAFEFPERDALLGVPGWPLIGGVGGLGKATDVADLEREYLRKGDAFLRGYERVVRWLYTVNALDGRIGKIIGYGVTKALRVKSGPKEFAAQVDRIVAGLRSELRRFRVRHAPPELKRDHGIIVARVEFYAREFQGLASAVRKLDVEGANRFDRTFAAGDRRFERRMRTSFLPFFTRSTYARSIRELQRLERRIGTAYDRL